MLSFSACRNFLEWKLREQCGKASAKAYHSACSHTADVGSRNGYPSTLEVLSRYAHRPFEGVNGGIVMKEAPRVAPTFLLLIFAIIGTTWGVQRAHAETISMFTGTWQMFAVEQAALRDRQNIYGLRGSFGSNLDGFFSFNGSISDYFDHQPSCNPFESGCNENENWHGTFSGGSVSFLAFAPNNPEPEYSFTGTISGGSFSGFFSCEPGGDGECIDSNDAMFSFISGSTNGWTSEGTLRVWSSCFPGCSSFGYLSMTTVTPEPGSMTLTLLGAGMVAVATLLGPQRARGLLRRG